ncbi:hypothetical protein GDO78_019782 [Eleutherodactylus coqui]|uniref:Uncharacterized protein n=1 Tax=Eleutherodactylus coqui TaxID=57060 RepID=A0A8J6EI79_ELECQ|nr:hypothetical protein GDO78_019782 [Eleutherodactylus coqui]
MEMGHSRVSHASCSHFCSPNPIMLLSFLPALHIPEVRKCRNGQQWESSSCLTKNLIQRESVGTCRGAAHSSFRVNSTAGF